jgi:hypothetical protein
MMGRRTAALLCVLLMHALVLHWLAFLPGVFSRLPASAGFQPAPITIELEELPSGPDPAPPLSTRPRTATSAAPPLAKPSAAGSTAITPAPRIDWPREGEKAAARLVAREAENERLAKMFAGPGGTWASLTRRQRSKLDKFRFKPGIDGLEYDAQGNQILHVSDGCAIVNSGFIACTIGKAKVRGDMFENMREYFDELRLPETGEGNGTEPEALRPPY